MNDDAEAQAQGVVDKLEALHDALVQAWLKASNSRQFDLAKDLNDQADRAGDQLIMARQHLLDAIDNSQDVTALQNQMNGLAATIKAQQDKVAAGTQTWGELSGVLDTVGQVITTAEALSAH